MGNAKRSDLVWPDYKNCIANLPNSVLKKVGAQLIPLIVFES